MISETQLWFLLNKKENKRFVIPYLSDRLHVERYSSPFLLPLMGSAIFTMLLLFFISLNFSLLYISFVLVILLLFEIFLYGYKKNKIIKYYYAKIDKGE